LYICRVVKYDYPKTNIMKENHCENEYLNKSEFYRCDKQCLDCELLEEKQ